LLADRARGNLRIEAHDDGPRMPVHIFKLEQQKSSVTS
jgi:hypothetical protein